MHRRIITLKGDTIEQVAELLGKALAANPSHRVASMVSPWPGSILVVLDPL